MIRRALPLLAMLAILAIAPAANAQTAPPDQAGPPVVHEPQPGLWARGSSRWFVSNTTDLGYLYFRPRFTFGYGKPFWRYVAIDASPLATNNGVAAYGGLRFAIPHADLRLGARYWYAFQHYFLEEKAHYDAVDLNQVSSDKSRYLSLEAEANFAVGAGPGDFIVQLGLSSLEMLPKDRYVYEETIRVITAPHWLWRERWGYAVRIGREGNASAGLVQEIIGLPGRGYFVFRAGFIGTFTITEHLEAILWIIPPIASPDTIGIAGGDIGQIGIRYRWATGTRPGL